MRCSRRAVPGRLAAALAAALAFTGACLVPGTAHAASCTVTWAGPAGATDLSGSWDEAANWSTGAVPTSDDDVCVTAPGTYTVTMTADEAVHSLTLGDGSNAPTLGFLRLGTPSLEVAADSTIAPGASLQLNGLDGSDAAIVSVAPGATLTNSGTLEVNASAWCEVDGGFDNEGTVIVAGRAFPYSNLSGLRLTGPLANADGAGTLTGGVWDVYGYLDLPTDTPITVNEAAVALHLGGRITGLTAWDLFQPQVNLGSITIDGGIWQWAAPFENSGVVDVGGAADVFAEGGYTQDARGAAEAPVTTVREGSGISLDHGSLELDAGTLTGGGYIGGWVGGVTNAGGIVRPDPTLYIASGGVGHYVQGSAGVLDIAVTGSTEATSIATNGSFTLSGTLRISTAVGVTPMVGLALPIISGTFPSPSGRFTQVVSTPASQQRVWQAVVPSYGDPAPAHPAVTIRSMLAPTLTETLSSSSVVYGTAVRITGRLTAAGAADANARVTLYRQAPVSSAWTALAAGTTNSTGAVAFTVTPTATYRYRLGAAADSTHLEATSASLTGSVHTQFTLTAGHQLTSPNGSYRLIMQSDGNLVEYGPGSRVAWSSHTNGHAGAYLAMQSDGNAVIYAGGRALWSTRTSLNPGARLVVQNDGNVVVYSTANRALWSSWADRSRSLGGVRPQ